MKYSHIKFGISTSSLYSVLTAHHPFALFSFLSHFHIILKFLCYYEKKKRENYKDRFMEPCLDSQRHEFLVLISAQSYSKIWFLLISFLKKSNLIKA
jgi:hypothetical protein